VGLAWGFGTSIIRRAELTRADVNGAFWSSIVIGSLLTCAAIVVGLSSDSFFEEPLAGPVILGLAPSLLLGSAATVPSSLLQRRFQFRQLYEAQILGVLSYIVLELGLAWKGFGAWAVIIGLLANATVTLVMVVARSHIRVERARVFRWLKREGRFATGIMSVQAVTTMSKSADYWLVGSILGTRSLGVYYMAYVLPGILRLRLTTILNTVLGPVFARTEIGSEQLADAYRRSTVLLLGAGLPAMLGLAVTAHPVVSVSLGERWAPAAPVLSILAVTMVLELLAAAPQRIAVIKGSFRAVLGCEGAGLVVLVSAAASSLVAGHGTVGVAFAVLIARTTTLALSMRYVASPLGVGICLIKVELAGILISALAMAAAVALAMRVLDGSVVDLGLLLICVPLGAALYLVLGRAFFPSTFRPLIHDGRLILTGR
jgi:PST family polysaccharide transporter